MTTDANPYPSLSTLYLYLTDRCNLRCSHCWIAPKYSQDRQSGIPFEALKSTILKAKPLGLCSVKLTGGEPLLYTSIIDLLEFLGKNQIGSTIETNGTLITQRHIDAFHIGQVSQISVSIDAASPAIHDTIRGRNGCFRQAVEGLELMVKNELNSQAIFTLQQKNKKELPDVIRLCCDLGIDSLKINHLIPCGRGADAFKRGDNLSLEELSDLYLRVKEEWDQPENLEIFFDLPLAFQGVEEITSRPINECHILNILGILGNGDFSICGIGQTVKSLRMGNIRTDDIENVWQHSDVLNDLRRSLPGELKGACGNCIFKFQCLGNCRANAYVVSGDLYAPYFLCQELVEKNRFPESRCIFQQGKP